MPSPPVRSGVRISGSLGVTSTHIDVGSGKKVKPAGITPTTAHASMWVLVTPNDPLIRTPERTGGLGIFGRLKPDVTLAAAQAEMVRLSSQLDHGIRYGVEMEPRVYPLQREFAFLADPNLRLSLFVLF